MFIYDRIIRNRENGLRIDVTVVDTDSDVMITLKSGCISFPVFIAHDTAMQLAAALTNAVCAYDRISIESGATKTSETTAD